MTHPRDSSRAKAWLVAALACLAGMAYVQPALAAERTLVGSGVDPGFTVDRAGTAYIAYNGVTTAPQPLRFCKLPRGAAACSNVVDLPFTGDGATSGSLVRPFVTVNGSTVRILTSRYGFTAGDFRRDLLFTSTDGGVSFGAGVAVGTLSSGGGAVEGPGAGISVVNTASDTHAFQRVPTDGSALVKAFATISTTFPYGGSVGLVNPTTPLVVVRNTSQAAFTVFKGGEINDGANWSVPQIIGPATFDRVAAGPRGLFVMLTTGGHLEVRRFGGATFGPPVTIPGSSSNSLSGSDLAQDAAGRLQAVFNDASGNLYQSSSEDGVTWATQTLTTSASLEEERVAAAADHGGLVVWTADTGSHARLYALPLAAPPAPAPAPAPAPVAPGRPLTHARFSLSSATVARGGTLTLDASGSAIGGAIAQSYDWDLNNDGRTDAACDGTTPVLTTRLPAAGTSAVKLVVADAAGTTSTALLPLTVTGRSGARISAIPAVPVGLSFKCTSPGAIAQDITAQGGPPGGCVEQVSFGIVDALGCFEATPRAQDIPIAERQIILPIFTTLANGRAASAATVPATRFSATNKAFATRHPVISHQAVRVNGLDITPEGGAVVAIIPSDYDLAGRVKKTGYVVSSNATIRVGTVTLQSGKVRVELPYATQTAHVFDFDLKRDVPFLRDVPLTGHVEGNLVDRATLLPAHVMLPGVFTDPSTGKGLSAEVTLRTSNRDGIQLDGLELRAPHVFLSGISLDNLFFRYRRADETYEGGGQVVLTAKQGDIVSGAIGFQRGSFKYLTLAYDAGPTSTGITIGPGVSIFHLGGAFRLNPTELDADTVIGMGVSTGGGCPLVGVRAAVNQHFSPGPYVLDAHGSVELKCIPLSKGYLHIDGDGYVSFGGSMDYSFKGLFSLKAQVDAQYLDPHFQVDGAAQACIGDLGCVGGEVVISDKGMGFCGEFFGLVHAGAGFTYPDATTLANPVTTVAGIIANASIMFTSCNVGQYRTLPTTGRAAQAGAPRSFTVTDPTQPLIVGVKGTTGVPQVTLAGPGGRQIQAPADGPLRTANEVVFHSAGDATEYFIVKAPDKGTWTLQPLDQSPPIAGVRLAAAAPDPRITATLRHRGRNYRLSYRWSKVPGQTVRFVEKAPGGERILGTANGPTGTLRFTPSDAHGSARRIVAQVQLDGRPQADLDLAHYSAGAARLVRPGHLRLRRAGPGVKATWAPVTGAAGYLLSASVDDGRRLLLRVPASRHAAAITPVARGHVVTAHVSALRRGGQPGPRSVAVRIRIRNG